MWFKCEKCNNIWKKSKINELRAYQLDPKKLKTECPVCKAKEVSWVINPQYNGKSIGIFPIIDMVKLDEPYKRDVGDDPRGPTESDFRIYKTTRDGEGDTYFWLPYWITIKNKKKFGQFSPIIREYEFTELIVKAIENGFFNNSSIRKIRDAVGEYEK